MNNNWQSGEVDSNGIKLHFTRTDGAKPPLVLAHGVTDDGLCWTPVAEVLALSYDVIMVDARGHGRSAAPEQGYDLGSQASDHQGLIMALGLNKPIVLGHSMGAITALALAGTYPDLPRAILLEDPPPWWSIPDQDMADEAERRIGAQTWFTSILGQSRESLLASQRAATPHWSEAELEPWAESKIRVSPNVMNFFQPKIPRAVAWQQVLPQITCPALLITADPGNGAIGTRDDAAALQRLIPQLQVVHIPKAGHNIRRDQFGAYMDVVGSFLTKLKHLHLHGNLE